MCGSFPLPPWFSVDPDCSVGSPSGYLRVSCSGRRGSRDACVCFVPLTPVWQLPPCPPLAGCFRTGKHPYKIKQMFKFAFTKSRVVLGDIASGKKGVTHMEKAQGKIFKMSETRVKG